MSPRLLLSLSLATGLLACHLRADFTDYYSIGYAGPNGVITHPQSGPPLDPPGGTAYRTALTPDFPSTQGV